MYLADHCPTKRLNVAGSSVMEEEDKGELPCKEAARPGFIEAVFAGATVRAGPHNCHSLSKDPCLDVLDRFRKGGDELILK